ncbi:U32 family peptidase [Rhodoblastus sp.]|uniref:ubiquinone anaerobic biosynthesis protein UbiV n=1 Tax=Rhodoblastus sp. TaxID=1962975 RepID=UPI00261FEB98|nr:U32 family peptidase [Rhodoblastus sp.]
MAESNFDLTLGPLQFNWPAQKFVDFYAAVADEAPVDRVVIGELVCSKRAPFYADRLPEAIERLERGGKQVLLGSLALVTLERERRAARETFDQTAHEVEINDLTLMNWVRGDKPFSVGPLVNVYNEATLAFLAGRGARRVCLPPELPFASVETIAKASRDIGVGIEVWAYGRMPLAISGRCYHARARGLSKDSCQFVCDKDPDGLPTKTLDGVEFLAINGVQTLSFKYANLILDLDRLADAGVAGLRLSPHSGDFIAVAKAFAGVCEGRISPQEGLFRLRRAAPQAEFTDGFLFGDCGAAPLPAF